MLSKYLDTSRIFSRLVFLTKNNLSKDFCLSSRLVFLTKNNLSKKSQIPAQIIIYVIAIILFSLILVYGYNAIKGFRERSEQIAYIGFKTELISTVKRISPDFGTIKREEFFMGGQYSNICFVQSYKQEENKDVILNNIENPIINDSVKGGVNKNVFLFTDKLQESFDVGDINVSGGYLCVPIKNGRARIQFEGRGDHTYIAEYNFSRG